MPDVGIGYSPGHYILMWPFENPQFHMSNLVFPIQFYPKVTCIFSTAADPQIEGGDREGGGQ